MNPLSIGNIVHLRGQPNTAIMTVINVAPATVEDVLTHSRDASADGIGLAWFGPEADGSMHTATLPRVALTFVEEAEGDE